MIVNFKDDNGNTLPIYAHSLEEALSRANDNGFIVCTYRIEDTEDNMTANYDTWLESRYQEQYDYEDELQEAIDNSLSKGGVYDPFELDNWSEASSECDLPEPDWYLPTREARIAHPQANKVVKYWEQIAHKYVEL